MLVRFSVRQRIWGLVALFVLGMGALSALHIQSGRTDLLHEKKLKTRHLVEVAHSLVAYHESRVRDGLLSREAAQRAAIEALRALRYDGSEYFWINDLGTPIPRMVMHATLPSLDGQVLDAEIFRCATSLQIGDSQQPIATDGRQNLFVAFNEVVRAGGHGYVTYHWPKPLPSGGASLEHFPKLSYIKLFAPWGWTIGSGIYTDDIDRTIRQQVGTALVMMLVVGGSLVLLASWIAATIVTPLARSARALIAMTHGAEPLAPLPVSGNDEVGTLISGFNQLQAALHEKEESLRLSASVFDNAREGIIITGTDGKIIGVNPSFTTLTGYAREEVIGKNPSLLKSGQQGPGFYAGMWNTLMQKGYWQGEISNRRKDGGVYVEMLTITTVRDGEGRPSHYVGIFSDVTALKEHQVRLEHMAHFDALTQLPNRVLLADRLQLALAQAERHGDLLAVAFLDLDEFKPINDRLGHEAGDDLLIEVSRRLKQCVRSGDTVARLGGDEFVLLLVGLNTPQEAHAALERILETLAEPCLLRGEPVSISASMGLTLYPLDDAAPEVLLRHADQAMYAAKQAGRNRYHLFETGRDPLAREQRTGEPLPAPMA